MSGFLAARVGSSCREIQPPDISFPNGINWLDAKCRECRVLKGVESARVLRVGC